RMNEVWRKRRFHICAALLAGPLAYLLLAFGAVAALGAVSHPGHIFDGSRVLEVGRVGGVGAHLLDWMAITFSSMFVLSVIPIPPTDGGRVLFLLGPTSQGWKSANYKLTESHLGVVLLLVVLLLPVLFQGLPDVVGQLVPPLLRGLGDVVGISL